MSKTERVPIMFDKGLVEMIDEYSFKNRIRTRAETIRQLVIKSLETNRNEKGEVTA